MSPVKIASARRGTNERSLGFREGIEGSSEKESHELQIGSGEENKNQGLWGTCVALSWTMGDEEGHLEFEHSAHLGMVGEES